MTRHWRRILALAAALVALYALAGFFGLPWLLRWQLPRMAQSTLQRQAAVEAVRFNPFLLRLQAQGLQLAEADGAPLLSVGDLTLQLQWRSLVRRAWSFEEVRIESPAVHLVISPEGQLNFVRLLEALQKEEPGPPDAGLPRLIVERFALAQGRVDLDDRQAGHTAVLAPIAFDVEHFSTLPNERDRHVFTAQWATGGRLHWQGEASLDPMRARGQLTLENVDLSSYAPYLRPFTRLVLADGRLAATLPYRIAYADGRLDAKLEGARLAVDRLALGREGAGKEPFAALASVRLEGVNADLASRELAVAAVRLQDGHVDVRRDAQGELDLAQLALPASAPAAAAPAAPVADAPTPWQLSIGEVQLAQVALRAVDETVQPPLNVAVQRTGLKFRLRAAQAPQGLQLKVEDASLALEGIDLTQAQRTPLKLARLGFSEGALDLAARRLEIGRVQADEGQLRLVRDASGALDLLSMLPRAPAAAAPGASTAPAMPAPSPAPAASAASAVPVATTRTAVPVAADTPWSALVHRVELARWTVDADDRPSGIHLHLLDVGAGLEGVGSDLQQPVAFQAGLRVAEGGQLQVRGKVVPATANVEAAVQATQLALRPLQPLLAQHVRLRIAGGTVSTKGQLKTGAAKAKGPAPLRYEGAFELAGLALNEQDGKPFLGWKSVAAQRFTVATAPAALEIPELRIVEPKAILILEDDRSFNAARLLVQKPASAPVQPVQAVAASAAPTADDAFAVRIRRVRLQNAHLDFEDRSLRPQFGARIHELNGLITGLSSQRDARSQIELDGRVGEFGLARVRGGLNPFAPRDNTDVGVIFRNVDLVPVSPYAMKFAGYRLAGGKVSLDLRYKVRDSRLEGENKIVLDQLTLGERVDSPDALKVPLELAIAILKDSDGRIDLGLPVSGDMSDPQFSYGGIIWKAIGTLLTKIVTAPFRALGAMMGVSGEKLEAIEFDPGSSRLLPPEREKLQHVGAMLAKRAQLKLTLPGGYHEEADGAALRAAAVRAEVTRRAGVKLAPGEAPGPLDLADRAVREALRDLYAERFGKPALDQARKEAEAAPAPEAPASGRASASLPAWQRALKFVQGEPQVADARAFYRGLRQRLERNQALPPDALQQLGAQRAQVMAAALAESGADAARVSAGAPVAVTGAVERMVPLKLELGVQR
ncbi:MAG TPA: DUF748 domain-containing protein [Ramlibacter sp.]|uniref:DUF748 domain-containing protein n=1 Tax=Ramlibacter sp. TaxID=1917967 RepID=UPI002D7F031B|nr:DUF748 domain-containing protein [Ramlibacter sp.]HET8743988.1 DUF748 domain-containing protein [Ramlibacter sp.]